MTLVTGAAAVAVAVGRREALTSLSFSSSSNLLRRMAPMAGEAGGVLDSLSSSSVQAEGGQSNVHKATNRRTSIHEVRQASRIIWKPQKTGISKPNGPTVSYSAVPGGSQSSWLRLPMWPSWRSVIERARILRTMYGTAGPRNRTL